ncbi:MAG: GNAT family N-acyltransferase, partial [Myxococcota bacterium]
MSVRIKLAEAPLEVHDILRVRHDVFVEEEGYLPPQDAGLLVDHYDALPTTTNLVATVDGNVVGGMRLTLSSDAGMPTDAVFDFTTVTPLDACLAAGGMLCVRREARMVDRLVTGLLQMIMYRAWASGCTHICGAMNPRIRTFVEY